jgi:hypothetical protein
MKSLTQHNNTHRKISMTLYDKQAAEAAVVAGLTIDNTMYPGVNTGGYYPGVRRIDVSDPNAPKFPSFHNSSLNQIQPFVPVQSAPNASHIVSAFKPKRAGKDTAHVIVVLDESSSMMGNRDMTISGFNEFIEGQKTAAKESGIATKLTLFKFNGSSVTAVWHGEGVEDTAPLTRDSYMPSGSTNLYDAIGGVIMHMNQELAKEKKKKRDSVTIVIMTDGEENCSQTFDNASIKAMIEKCEGKGWGFMFLGANIDAFAVGSTLGFRSDATIQFNNHTTAEALRSAGQKVGRMSAAYATGLDINTVYETTAFTAAERAVSLEGDKA